MLAKRYQEHGDTDAAHKLVTSHLRLVAKIAMGYRGYGLPIGEVISEGNVGLMQAVKKFEPERGFRLATYAMWWIKASIQEYVLRSWSLVKMGTTANQKRLFFNLRKVKSRSRRSTTAISSPNRSSEIATKLGVSRGRSRVDEPPPVRRCLAQRADPRRRRRKRRMAGLAGRRPATSRDSVLIEQDELEIAPRHADGRAMASLNDRETPHLRGAPPGRRAGDAGGSVQPSSTSRRERVRQIEVRAFEKVQKAVKAAARDQIRQLKSVEHQPGA